MKQTSTLSVFLFALLVLGLTWLVGSDRQLAAQADNCPTPTPTSMAAPFRDLSFSGQAGMAVTDKATLPDGLYRVSVTTDSRMFTLGTQIVSGDADGYVGRQDNPMLISLVAFAPAQRASGCSLVFQVTADAPWKLLVSQVN